MALTETPRNDRGAPTPPAPEPPPRSSAATSGNPSRPRGIRPGSRRRARIAAGAAIAAVAIGGNVLVYTSLDERTEVVQVVRNVRAGEPIAAADLRTVAVDVDPTVPVVAGDRLGTLVGQYARTAIASGSLMTPGLVQPEPLVSDGAGVVALEIEPTRVPFGLVERSRVQLVVVPGRDEGAAFVADGRIVARGDDVDSITGASALSIEVAADHAPILAAADDVRVVLLQPDADPALEGG